MTARRELTCTVAEMQAGDEWHGRTFVRRWSTHRPGWSWVAWQDGAGSLLPVDLTVTVLRAEPTVDVPVSVIEDVQTLMDLARAGKNPPFFEREAGAYRRLRRFLAGVFDVGVER